MKSRDRNSGCNPFWREIQLARGAGSAAWTLLHWDVQTAYPVMIMQRAANKSNLGKSFYYYKDKMIDNSFSTILQCTSRNIDGYTIDTGCGGLGKKCRPQKAGNATKHGQIRKLPCNALCSTSLIRPTLQPSVHKDSVWAEETEWTEKEINSQSKQKKSHAIAIGPSWLGFWRFSVLWAKEPKCFDIALGKFNGQIELYRLKKFKTQLQRTGGQSVVWHNTVIRSTEPKCPSHEGSTLYRLSQTRNALLL